MLHRDEIDGVHRVEEAHTNWYLVEDGGAVTVVDTGFPRSWGTLQRSLREIGRGTGDVAAVVQTHAHFDHMGFTRRAGQDLGVDVWAHERELPVVAHPWRYDHENSRLPYLRHPGFLRAFSEMAALGALWVRGAEGARTYADGETLDVPGRPRVVFTPGHTYGHCSLHLAGGDAVISGDALVTFDPYTGKSGPQIVSGAATADSRQALRSLDALEETGARTVLPGHGEPWREGISAAAEKARAAGPS
jgi:glyoxylase-like metal-dependent hydrolase (beta-lactamase superfamily II)